MTQRETLLEYLRGGRILRHRDIPGVFGGSVQPSTLTRLVNEPDSPVEAVIEKGKHIGYQLTTFEPDIYQKIAASRPGAVLCGASALYHWDLTDNPAGSFEEQIAVPTSSSRRIHLDNVALTSWSNPDLFKIGVVNFEGFPNGQLFITDPARTVLDQFRRTQGRRNNDEVAREALARLYAQDNSCLTKIGVYAVKLGCFADIAPHVQMLKEATKWNLAP
ncbi:type IV toxin-antitoxin system AbiEi family antitoxin domain-containing protein [Thalassospira xiamenensis]|uniref:Transcriptional regulator, AbiEi antitoxin, Type IV TA system n=1 Tax=Thalassospira xiamenensis TaxID=220697 RepID=A0A285TGV7_9PROT|nr:hypothetical protein [Thalassospira xiamenensis]SOC21435.1 hypothetical protein SAMN05428964_103403 [Thalassospira xiamenensis]